MASDDTTATYTIGLEDDVSPASETAAQALERLKKRISEGTDRIRQLQAAMARMKAGGLKNTDQYKKLNDALNVNKRVVAFAQAQYVHLGGSLGEIAKSTKGAAGGLADVTETARSMPGPVGAIASRLGGLRGLLAGGPLVAGALALATAFLAIVAASAALVGAIAAATAQLLRYGIAQADARRSELLHLEGLTRIRSMFGLAAGSATELQGAIDRVSDSSALGRVQVAGYAEQLYRMGLRGGALEEALDAVSIAGSAGGERMARRFAGMAAAAARAGGSVHAVADAVRARFGGIAARQALGLDRQMERLRENIAQIFGTLRIEGFLRALRQVTSLFSQSTSSGRALRHLVEVLFQPLIDGIGRSGPIARRFFQGLILGAQRVTILVLRLRNWFLRTFGATDILGGIDTQTAAMQLGTYAVYGLVAAAVTAVAVLGMFAAALAALAAPILVPLAVLGTLSAALVAAASAFGSFVRSIVTQVEKLDFTELGAAMANGLVVGLIRGRARVAEAVRGLASSAVTALRGALEIHSPSQVFAELGTQIPRGLAEGVDAGAPVAAGAVEGVVGVPETAGGARGAAARASISIGDIYVQVGQTDNPRHIGQSIVDEIVQALQGVRIELGAGT